ncbi:MAG: thioredoxin family protein [Bacteroidetes bacterium HGW-Bacteroidetes-4]|jgi:thiol-disulfide isomerase/thioredoxin|nr:MAG: thioredoxin family protein [Bacteroidetes bacterium HGW-Bacteroidetes-4]
MALAFTEQIPLGYPAKEFILPEPLSGKNRSLKELASEKATVILFICNHCPYVKHVNKELVAIANHYLPKGISFIAINSNDAVKYPDDSPEKMVEVAKKLNYPFPYLYDESQGIAKAYHAVCTPDISVFDKDLKCVYRGQIDDSRPGNDIPLSGKDLRRVLDALLNNQPVPKEQIPSAGCSIKWK